MISVDAIFKIINFLIIAFIFVVLFKQRLAPYFVKEKHRYDDEIESKKQAQAQLLKQLDQLLVEGDAQQLEGKVLQDKCKAWALKIEQKHEQQKKDQAQIRLNMIQHRQKQSIFVQQQKCLQQQLPLVFAQVEAFFKESGDKDQVSKEYCDDLITFMKE
jgi:hypothetical protein